MVAMVVSLLSFLIGFLWQAEIPFKPNDEFQLELEYTFKQKPGADHLTYDFTETVQEHSKKQYSGGPLPYLLINFKTLKLSGGEVRVRGINSDGNMVVTKKVEVGSTFKLDMGYTDDMKDRVTPHAFTIYYLSDKKKEISRVNLFIEEDGTFLVNGEVRGKF